MSSSGMSAASPLNAVLINSMEVEHVFDGYSVEPIAFWHSAYSATLQGLQIRLINA